MAENIRPTGESFVGRKTIMAAGALAFALALGGCEAGSFSGERDAKGNMITQKNIDCGDITYDDPELVTIDDDPMKINATLGDGVWSGYFKATDKGGGYSSSPNGPFEIYKDEKEFMAGGIDFKVNKGLITTVEVKC